MYIPRLCDTNLFRQTNQMPPLYRTRAPTYYNILNTQEISVVAISMRAVYTMLHTSPSLSIARHSELLLEQHFMEGLDPRRRINDWMRK